MESNEELQQLELTALKSIYGDDFIDVPPPKAWKGAARLPEFNIRISAHDDYCTIILNVRFPKTYPRLAYPTFTITKPYNGINNDQISQLTHGIHAEAQVQRGAEMVFFIVSFCQDWLDDHIVVPKEASGSLAVQMNQRAEDEAKARKQKEQEEEDRENQQVLQMARKLEEQIEADAQRQHDERMRQFKARKRANSDTTEVPLAGDIPTETFDQEIEFNGVHFDTVKYFHPRRYSLGITYAADPVSDDFKATLPLELYVVTFETHYYTTSQGRKKLTQVEAEIQRLITVHDNNVSRVLGVKLRKPHSGAPPQLIILSEQCPALTLQDVLEDSESLREDRATDYLSQVLSGLNAIHNAELVHRGISPKSIGLTSRDHPTQSKLIKLTRVGYLTRLNDLNKSNSFSDTYVPSSEDPRLPDAWLSNDVKNESSLLYTRSRDIHSVGIVSLQMLLGLRVTEHFSDVHTALHRSVISPQLQSHILNMILPSRKSHISCLTLLAGLAESSLSARSPSHSPVIPLPEIRTPLPYGASNSPDEYFRILPSAKSSRWKEDWEELELLGKGGFGSVVKARNRIDSRIYAVKKIRLKNAQFSDAKIFREVNALSRLSHRFIVRYYTTWVETSEPTSSVPSDDSNASSSTDVTADGNTSVPSSREVSFGPLRRRRPTHLISRRSSTSDGSQPRFSLYDDFDDENDGMSISRGSFPSIHFSSGSGGNSSTEEDTDSDGDNLNLELLGNVFLQPPGTPMTAMPRLGENMQENFFRLDGAGFGTRTLYIQMEFVERQTLKERINEGLSEDQAWRLFQQIVEALVHMSTLGILHRDIKLTNIFIDAKGDCKVGDFGLATSSLAAVDPSDVSPRVANLDNTEDMTREVGTLLYIAPEVRSRKRGPTNHSKADIYSLGIVFFEMSFTFSTGAERIAVIEDLRKPEIYFPATWDPHLTRQRQIIHWLLQHEPDDRPSALELSQSPLVPHGFEEEYFRSALTMMAKPDSPHHEAMLASLFNQTPRPSRSFLYDADGETPEFGSLTGIVLERLTAIFRLHGAIDMEPPLFMPAFSTDDQSNQASLIDRHGDLVILPNNAVVPFARLAAKSELTRIKRYHIKDIYRPNPVAGHPRSHKAAIFDIITPDIYSGPAASSAEIVAVANRILDSFPQLDQSFDIQISHSTIIEIMLERVPAQQRTNVIDTLLQTKSSTSQKRASLLKRGLLRSTVDELELLSDVDEVESMIARLEKASPSLATLVRPHLDAIKSTMHYASCAGAKRPILFHPLMLGGLQGHGYSAYYKNGVLVEVVRKTKRTDVLAAGGRFDALVSRYSAKPSIESEPIHAFGFQISVDKIKAALAVFQGNSLKTWVSSGKSFGFWSRKRCDVYVVSSGPGALKDRLEIGAWLWEHGVSADFMYETGLAAGDYVDICKTEGILFLLYPRPKIPTRRDQLAFRVKHILKGEEIELSKHDLVPWLRQEIAEQARLDTTTAGVTVPLTLPGVSTTISAMKVTGPTLARSVIQPVLPGVEMKKQRKQIKNIFEDRAFESAEEIKKAFLKTDGGMPTLAIDVPSSFFDALVAQSPALWLHCDRDETDEAWKNLIVGFGGSITSVYASQIRDAVIKRKSEGHKFIMVYAVREEKMQLLQLGKLL